MTEWYRAIRTIQLHGRSIMMGGGMGLVIAVMVFAFQPRVWQAEMILAPTERATAPLSNTSYFASSQDRSADAPVLYRQPTGQQDSSPDFTMLQAMMLSPAIIEQFYEESKDLHGFTNKDDLYLYLQNRVKIRPYGQTQFVRTTFRHDDAAKASQILNQLYVLTDQKIRDRKNQMAQARIEYLNDQLSKTLNPSHRGALLALLREQEQISMMVAIDRAFAADIVSAAHTHPKPVAPNFMILAPAFMVIAGLIGLVASGLHRANRAFKIRNIIRPPKKSASNVNKVGDNPDRKIASR